MSDIVLNLIEVVAVVATFMLSTSMLVVLWGQSGRIPRFLLSFLQSAAAGRPLVRTRDWRALLIFCFIVAGVLFAEGRILELTYARDGSLDIQTIVDLVLEAGWVGFLLSRQGSVSGGLMGD
jgi:hypothetical protein